MKETKSKEVEEMVTKRKEVEKMITKRKEVEEMLAKRKEVEETKRKKVEEMLTKIKKEEEMLAKRKEVEETKRKEVEEMIAKIKEVEWVIAEIKEEVEEMLSKIKEVEETLTKIKEVEEMLTKRKEVEEMLTKIKEVEEMVSEIKEVEEMVSEIKEVEEMVSEIKEVEEMLTKIKEVEEMLTKIKEVEEIMKATTVDEGTALHMAVRNCLEKENIDTYLKVVKLLSEEDAEFQHPPNKFQETPLYLAAERGIMGVAIVETLVETYRSLLTYSGPGGRTALHAAALKDSTGRSTKKLLEWKKDLINQADAYGWLPFHYAACNWNVNGVEELLAIDQSVVYITTTNKDDQDTATSNGNENGVREILATDISAAYITTTNKDDLDTALHIAAAHGHVSVIEKLVSSNPDCWEMVNSKGQNVLHIAVDMNKESVIKFILAKSWVGQLINQKDNEGNTPLHLLIASDCNVDALWKHHRADHHAFNGKNMTPVDLVWSNSMEERTSTFAATYIMDDTFLDSEIGGGRNLACNAHVHLAKLEKARRREKQERKMTNEAENRRKEAENRRKEEADEKENHDAIEHSRNLFQTFVIVAALIATITFAAAFTIPGGYDGNQGRDQGMAILARAAAFKAFVITNTIAMVCSLASIFLCLSAVMYGFWPEEAADRSSRRYVGAWDLIIVSMFFLMIAFIAATFAVLAHSIALAVSTCIIACIPFIAYILELGKFISWAPHS
ncbi:hypothetical protein RHMOL_Rhmol02G0102900 [Rhododendron molle]|uniref:Uncharacterized protein n=1 Tax=Rhododendron molle TaxID=49168 RepID=A0ACC0PQW8_RHOML|nr:hypothetical protein RHMOL_Rhmol02G0102900 [Rhododendron molle]